MDYLLNHDFMPHGHCFLWRPDLLWLHVLSDIFIALAYYTIPVALIYLVKKRTDLRFNLLFVLFAVFIFACGTTHLVGVLNVWHGYYYLEGWLKAITACVSIVTALILWPLMPKLLAIPSQATLEQKNNELLNAQASLQQLNNELEQRISERTAALQRVNVDLERFAHLASHDLRGPLRGMNTYAQILLEDYGSQLDEPGLKKLTVLVELTHKLDEMIASLLEYSRISANKTELAEVNVKAVLDEVLALLCIELEGTQLISKVSTDVTLKTDPVYLAEVLRNLVGNAIKYNDKLDKRIEIGLLSVEQLIKKSGIIPAGVRTTCKIVYVKDNGIGIKSEHLTVIFEMFKRLSASNVDQQGSGIGLAMVKRMIEQHGGYIWVESTYGKGSTFYFTHAGN
ncbi:MAG: hypothetical protein H0W44_08355 [Gammaproteobacteria bacterium]|nr:hypothetical protein [Gammaproteobacteria bacterium]